MVCWDLSHNPVGRAFVLYKLLEPDWDVELIGPVWSRFGSDLWPPLKDEGIRHRILPTRDLADVWAQGAAVALAAQYDLVVVSKPRLPAVIIGLLIAEQSQCPVIFDVDEAETAFTAHRLTIESQSPNEALLNEPFAAVGTEIANSFIARADAVTASNPIVAEAYAAHLVRHARDEATPLPAREAARQRLKLNPDDFVIAFLGTARAHKGIDAILTALDVLDEERIKLLLVGSIPDAAIEKRIAQHPAGRILRFGNCPMSRIGSFLAAADLVPILQDPDSPIASTQIPAKLTDALQFDVPVVASNVPPLRDIAARGGIDLIEADGLADFIATVRSDGRRKPPRARRRLFEEEFSYAVNRARLGMAITAAQSRYSPMHKYAGAMLSQLRTRTEQALSAQRSADPMVAPAVLRNAERTYDIAFFWKQNDSGLFGRRSDMVVKYLLSSGRVRRIVQFDHSIKVSEMRLMAEAWYARDESIHAAQLPGTLARALKLADGPSLDLRLCVTGVNGGARSLAGLAIEDEDRHADFIASTLKSADMDPANTIAWVCPIVWGFPKLARKLQFEKVVVDLVDDQRTWSKSADKRSNIETEYVDTLEHSDLVFTNCEGNRRGFSALYPDITVVPNGVELDDRTSNTVPSPDLAALQRPVIGYVGSIGDKIDWDLVQETALLRPGWTFVFIGPVVNHLVPDQIELLPNVRFVGPLPYEVAREWIRNFDVAIMPHLRSSVTDAMHPLKLYNYLAMGAPVVSTPVANLDEIQDLIGIEGTADGFVAAIDARLHNSARIPADRLAAFSWDRRVGAILENIDKMCAVEGAA